MKFRGYRSLFCAPCELPISLMSFINEAHRRGDEDRRAGCRASRTAVGF